MSVDLTEGRIKKALHRTYQRGRIASVDGNPRIYQDVKLKCAAVMILMTWWRHEWQLVFTRRTETVEHHKGQVSFPGGACNLEEDSPEQTALRETWEEIGIRPEDVRILGRLNDVLTITRYQVSPIVGVISWPYEVHLEMNEVARVFTIPLMWLAQPENWNKVEIQDQEEPLPFPVITYKSFDGEVLWGASARITHNFLEVLGLLKQ